MSPRQAPRDLRASDADRDRVLVMLAEAVSDGRLTMEEHAERVQRACTARTLGELADLTSDLAVASAQPVRLDGGRVISGIFGPARRDGRWVVPDTLTVTAMFGEVEVDFTQAILQARHVQLLTTVIGGRLRLLVPDGVSVAVTTHVMVGRKRGGTPPPARSDAPVIEVKGVVLGGEIIVRTPPRPRRRLFGRRRPPISRSLLTPADGPVRLLSRT
jgi:DUF1707 SHOCT-like domain/Cell wall-active antibiotics response LiaF, C-terminal